VTRTSLVATTGDSIKSEAWELNSRAEGPSGAK